MADWLMALALLLVLGCAGGCAWTWRRRRRLSDAERPPAIPGGAKERLPGSSDRSGSRTSEATGDSPPARPGSPLETLQRRFVQGEIGLEEYEREVDRLYGR